MFFFADEKPELWIILRHDLNAKKPELSLTFECVLLLMKSQKLWHDFNDKKFELCMIFVFLRNVRFNI